MRNMLTMFGQAFEEVPTYCDRQPSEAYLEGLLARDSFIALATITEDGNVVGGLAAYLLEKFEQSAERFTFTTWRLRYRTGGRASPPR